MVERKRFLLIKSINIMYPIFENMIVMPITKLMEIIMGIQVYLISRMNFDYKENGRKKAFLAIQIINIVYPIKENMIAMPISKRKEIIIGI